MWHRCEIHEKVLVENLKQTDLSGDSGLDNGIILKIYRSYLTSSIKLRHTRMYFGHEEHSAFRVIPTMRGQIQGLQNLKQGAGLCVMHFMRISQIITIMSLRMILINRVFSP